MSAETALSQIKGLILAMKDMQEKKGENAQCFCAVIEKHLEHVKEELEKSNAQYEKRL